MNAEALVARVESASRSIWSPDELGAVDGWELSASAGYTRRLNSATAVGTPGISRETGEAIAAWFAARSLPMIIRITPLMEEATAVGAAAAWDLVRVDPTPVMTKEVGGSVIDHGDVSYTDPGGTLFTDELFHLNGRDRVYLPQWHGIVSRLSGRGVGLWVPGAGVGFVGVHGDVGCVYSIAVHPDRRRTGVASRLMAAAETWAGTCGASTMALQVMGTNGPAIALYEHLGYRTAYEYAYLQRPDS